MMRAAGAAGSVKREGAATQSASAPAKKPKTAPAKAKASALPLKKGQATMGAFFKKK